jgi:hypothetical protein
MVYGYALVDIRRVELLESTAGFTSLVLNTLS